MRVDVWGEAGANGVAYGIEYGRPHPIASEFGAWLRTVDYKPTTRAQVKYRPFAESVTLELCMQVHDSTKAPVTTNSTYGTLIGRITNVDGVLPDRVEDADIVTALIKLGSTLDQRAKSHAAANGVPRWKAMVALLWREVRK